jgi:hypothetical protein
MRHGDPQTLPFYWLAAAVCGIVALWAVYRFWVSLRRDRFLADTPLARIRSAAQGYVKLFGRAGPAQDGALAAPLTSRPCVWWHYNVEQKFRNGKGETRWESIDSATSINLFVLTDGDAQCLVGPVNAEITPTTHDVWYGAECRPMGLPRSGGLLHSGDYRYTENLLSVGDRLSAVGELRSHSELGGVDSAAELLNKWKHDQQTLLARFDKDHDGRLDAAEWEAARQAAINESQSKALAAPMTRMSVISQPTNGEPFLIAAMDSGQLVRREKLHAALFMCLGLGCVTLGAWSIEQARAHHDIAGPPILWALIVTAPGVAAFVSRRLKRET